MLPYNPEKAPDGPPVPGKLALPKKVAAAPQGGVNVRFCVGVSVIVLVGRAVLVIVGVFVIVGVLVEVLVGVTVLVKVNVEVWAKLLFTSTRVKAVSPKESQNREVVIERYPSLNMYVLTAKTRKTEENT